MAAGANVSSASEEEVEYKHLDLAELIGTPPTRTQTRRVQSLGATHPTLCWVLAGSSSPFTAL